MADVNVTVYSPGRTLATSANYTDNKTAASSGNNYYIPNNGSVVLIVAAGTTSNVTIQTPNTVDGLAITDQVIALADTGIRVLGPFPGATYNDSQGRLLVTVSAATDLLAVRI
jgi:hypothetical protein